MARIDLRDLHDDDRDAAYTLLREGHASWRRAPAADRDAFDAWLDAQLADDEVTLQVVTRDAGMVGLVAVLTVGDDREIVFALSPDADADEDVTTEALRRMTAREPLRPLYACVAASEDPSHAVLAGLGFVESERGDGEIVYVLPPTLE